MYVYVVPYLILVSYAFALTGMAEGRLDGLSKRAIFLVGLLPAILFVVFRGNVGTDTGNYLGMVEEIGANLTASHEDFDVEIGFFLLMKGLTLVFGDPHVVVNLVSLSIALYAYRIFSGSTERILVFSLLIFPIFFFDMSMNGLRYALAFLVAKDSADRWARDQRTKSVILLVLCVTLQVSGLLVFLLLRLGTFSRRAVLYIVPLLALFFYLFWERLAYKFLAYQMLESPGAASGLLPLVIFFAAYAVVSLADSQLWRRFSVLALLEALSFVLARFTYAGLRFQLLILFVLFCAISSISLQSYAKGKNIVVMCLFVIGFVGFLGSLKHYLDDSGVPPSPFLPYTFFWEAK